MILDFGSFIINESSLKKLKRQVHGSLNMSARKRMRKELRDNIITFKFKKRNGDIRTAHGTLHPDYLPPLKGGGPRPEHQMVYYDLDKKGWRSFRSYTFIKILNIKPAEGKPHPKPITKEEDEEEVKKKPIHIEDEEKVKEKDEKVKEKEEKKKVHEIDDEIEDDDDHKSILDDKETPEEEELIKKEKEEERGKEDDKEKDKKEEKSEDE